MKQSVFMKNSVAHGCEYGEFAHLSEKDKKKLIKIMSKVMERAYRRGVQQALTVPRDRMNQDFFDKDLGLYNWRYEKRLSTSEGIDGFKTKSIERLFMEDPCLIEIGFYQ